jgi:hypothetical protein
VFSAVYNRKTNKQLDDFRASSSHELQQVRLASEADLAKQNSEWGIDLENLKGENNRNLEILNNKFARNLEALKGHFDVEKGSRIATIKTEGPLIKAASRLKDRLNNFTHQRFCEYLHNPAKSEQVQMSTCFYIAQYWAACERYLLYAFPSEQYSDREKVGSVRRILREIQSAFADDQVRDGFEFFTSEQELVSAKMTSREMGTTTIADMQKFIHDYQIQYSGIFQNLLIALLKIDTSRPTADLVEFGRFHKLQTLLQKLLDLLESSTTSQW